MDSGKVFVLVLCVVVVGVLVYLQRLSGRSGGDTPPSPVESDQTAEGEKEQKGKPAQRDTVRRR